jgi:hypothetical protein
MTGNPYFWLIQSYLKEMARQKDVNDTSVEDFRKSFQEIIDAELSLTSLEERVNQYNEDGWE